jgi:hypothetical protein
MLGVPVLGALRVVVALIDAHTARRACRVDDVLEHFDAVTVTVAVGDAGAEVRDELRRLREVVEDPVCEVVRIRRVGHQVRVKMINRSDEGDARPARVTRT